MSVCFVWPSACAVRATWFERTFANAFVGGLPVGIGGLLPGGEPVPGAADVEDVVTGALEGVEVKATARLMLRSCGESR